MLGQARANRRDGPGDTGIVSAGQCMKEWSKWGRFVKQHVARSRVEVHPGSNAPWSVGCNFDFSRARCNFLVDSSLVLSSVF